MRYPMDIPMEHSDPSGPTGGSATYGDGPQGRRGGRGFGPGGRRRGPGSFGGEQPRRGPGRRHEDFGDGFFEDASPEGFGPRGRYGRGRGFGPGGPRRGPGRGRRGDVRNAILALLREGPHNGYQIIGAIAERTEDLWRPSAGSVYPALGLLEDEGLIEATDVEGKKAFQLTEAGTAYVAEHAEELNEPWAKVAKPHEGYLDVRAEVGGLAMALTQVVRAGDKNQIERARTVLADARKALYRILAED
ncbi:MAG: PadR family transcriptional regulator [Nostocoides sp.]